MNTSTRGMGPYAIVGQRKGTFEAAFLNLEFTMAGEFHRTNQRPMPNDNGLSVGDDRQQ